MNGNGAWKWVATLLVSFIIGNGVAYWAQTDKMPREQAEKKHEELEEGQREIRHDLQRKLDRLNDNIDKLMIQQGIDPVPRTRRP